jgi:hypothetical protein
VEHSPTAHCRYSNQQRSGGSALYTSPTQVQDDYQDCGKRREVLQLAERLESSRIEGGAPRILAASHTDKCRDEQKAVVVLEQGLPHEISGDSLRLFLMNTSQILVREVACSSHTSPREDCTHSKHNFASSTTLSSSNLMYYVNPEEPNNDAPVD